MAGGTREIASLSLAQDGAELHPGAARSMLGAALACFQDEASSPGRRIASIGKLRPFLACDGDIGRLAARHLGKKTQPVRLIAFDKSAGANWSLGWHQNRTICVADKHNIDGFGPWTTKQGLIHVEPPFSLIESMVTARIHLDRVTASNAPLKIALGSHHYSQISEAEVEHTVAQ